MPTASKSSSSETRTLRSLYNRAVRSFINRDILETHSLIESAFTVLDSLQSPGLVDFLRKWDILKITFETTVYSSPSPNLPDELRGLSLKTPQAFVSDLFNRSLKLFAKARGPAAFENVLLPAPVLITLVYSSLKLECPESGRRMIEDWLAKRGDSEDSSVESLAEDGGYEKVIELYCIQVLPKLEQWDYATEFLEYESELAVDTRENFKSTLRVLHAQMMQPVLPSASLLPPPHPSPSPRTRSTSPAPSSSSSSSSLSTTSTHTIVPPTPRPLRRPNGHLNGISPASSSSSDSDGTATPTGNGFNNPTGPYTSSRSKRHHHPLNPNGPTPFSLPRSNHNGYSDIHTTPRLSSYALFRASLEPYRNTWLIRMLGKTKWFLVILIMVAVSMLIRTRRSRWRGSATQQLTSGIGNKLAGPGGVELAKVKQRLRSANDQGGLMGIWGEVVRAVVDTVRMGGSGLV